MPRLVIPVYDPPKDRVSLLILDVDGVELDLLLDDGHLQLRLEEDPRDLDHLTDDVVGVPAALRPVDQDQPYGFYKIKMYVSLFILRSNDLSLQLWPMTGLFHLLITRSIGHMNKKCFQQLFIFHMSWTLRKDHRSKFNGDFMDEKTFGGA